MRVQACCSIGWRMSSRKPEPLPANDQPLVGPLLQNRQQNAAQAENSAAQLFLLTAPSLTPLPQRPSCSFFRLFPCSPALPSRAAPLLLSLSPVPLLTCSPVLAQRPSCSFFRLFPCSPVLLFSRSAPPPLSFPRKRESIFSSSSRPMHFFLSNLKLQICYSSSFYCSPAHLFNCSPALAACPAPLQNRLKSVKSRPKNAKTRPLSAKTRPLSAKKNQKNAKYRPKNKNLGPPRARQDTLKNAHTPRAGSDLTEPLHPSVHRGESPARGTKKPVGSHLGRLTEIFIFA